MFALFLSLLACATPQPAEASCSPAPGNWFYAGDAIDWSSVHMVGADVVFRTVSDGLRSGPVRGAWQLTCGPATRATLLFENGQLVDVHTVPEAPCVESAAHASDWGGLALDGATIADTTHAVVVYDVPAEDSCSSCS